ncbi:MAG: hypothetical protein COZ98_00985 [Candidatus Omnitrophica bacterium CG_4_8_14_3_um_filter_43_15]|nr:MAG: hypothetical protein AUJ89_03945 [Candidatus Omnitrophica bacterium CG1_02_43_210]PIV12271.1 MAG: hypothetical protein COS48_01675 [Candidatus Omnitrophica bacterium CG03_land_8_20_14_0_80_43_22]PIW80680.1 MAG: hypothetical protein COZ98_00985 [Candidatus Omnitrophica bacterium CG_4_8_14_3_um_filter_43_15]PIY84202.1 MAG: hypothetical protein COY77_03680 [Candidatus Omnitrophica bacterium CG_4_10_14_0_8_um_filter_43_18]PJC45914.1 MAG: hypothetical protein CO036_05640 [Candidatus Omnitrop
MEKVTRGLLAALKFFAVRCGLRLAVSRPAETPLTARRNSLRTFGKKFLMRRSQATSPITVPGTAF